jgi:hypothetical protein
VSTGLNAAIGAATGDIIVRLDAHTYARDYVRECVSVLENATRITWGTLGGRRKGKGWVEPSRPFDPRSARVGARRTRTMKGRWIRYLGCWARTAFDRAGLLIRVWCGIRTMSSIPPAANGRACGSRLASNQPIRRASLSALFRQYMQYGYWRVAVIRKHRSLASWRHWCRRCS